MSNRRLKALLEEITDQTNNASNSHDILKAIELAKKYDGKIKFNNVFCYTLFVLGIVGIASHFLELYKDNNLMLVSVLTTMLSIIIFFHHKNLLDKTSDNIYIKNMLFENNMQELDVNASEAQMIKAVFKREFSRGNNKNQIKVLYKYSSEDINERDYYCYQYHYVNKSDHSSGDDSSSSSSSFQHFDRYGFITTLNNANNSNIKAPSIETEINRVAESFKAFSIDIDEDGFICISFKDKDVIGANRKFGIDAPDEFYNEMSIRAEMKKLNLLITLAATIETMAAKL